MPYAARILVPTDFSPPSSVALDHALLLAELCSASLHVVHVANPVELRTEHIEAHIAAVLCRCTNERLVATAQVLVGIPAEAIVQAAADRSANLIVMGTHGRQGLSHLVLGSVAEQVVRTAPCPVLTVRGPLHERTVAPVMADLLPVRL